MAEGGRDDVFDQDVFFSLGDSHMKTFLLIFVFLRKGYGIDTRCIGFEQESKRQYVRGRKEVRRRRGGEGFKSLYLIL
jgi:hypothetical protein